MGTLPDESDEYYQLLAELYVLSERLLDETIRGALIKEFVRLARLTDKNSKRYCPTREAVNIIYRGTTAASPARRLMVDLHVAYGTTKWFDSTCEAGFVLDVAQRIYAKMESCGSHSDISTLRSSTLVASEYMS